MISRHLLVWQMFLGCLFTQFLCGEPQTVRERLSGERVMHVFDFEERDVHYDDLPMYWTKCVGPAEDYPHYASGRLSATRRRSGEYSFALVPYGGSVGYEYGQRLIRARPGSDFHVSGYVHLENVRRTRAQLSCALTDRAGREIPGSRSVSRLVGPSDLDEDGWARLEVYVPGNFREARFITLGVWMLQEAQWTEEPANEARIFQADVKAMAWFDDISVYQLPRVLLRTGQPGNVFAPEVPVSLRVEVEGVASLDYQIRLSVTDAAETVISDEKWLLAGVEDAIRVRNIDLPDLAPGLYQTRMDIESAGEIVATRRLSFVRLAPLSGDRTASGLGFGVLLLDDTGGDWDTAVKLARLANARLIKVPVWRRRDDQAGSIFSEPDFDSKLLELPQLDLQLVATFSEVPDSLWLKMKGRRRTVLDMLSQKSELWVSQVAPVLSRYSRQIPFWQIGPDAPGKTQYWEPRIRGVVDTMRAEFEGLVGQTILSVPLNGMLEVGREQTGTDYVALTVPAEIRPEEVTGYIEDWRGRGIDHIWATIEPLDSEVYLREEVLIDLAKRIAFGKKGGAEAIYIDHPWTRRLTDARESYAASEVLLVFRTMADHLGGMTYVGEFELAEGVTAMIFDFDGTGCLFAWDNGGQRDGQESQEILVYLGQKPSMVDILGNVTPLPSERGLSRLRVGRRPVILRGINTRLAQLRASVKIEPQDLDANLTRQQVKVRFANPFGSVVTGRARFLVGREHGNDWEIEPTAFNFMLRPKELLEREISIKLPRNGLGGGKRLEMLIVMDADRSYRLRAAAEVEVSMKGVELGIFARRLGERDLMVQMVVTNISDSEVSLNSFVDLPDGDHLERAIARLQPGMNSSKVFPIRDAAQWVGQFLRVGLYEARGSRRISYHVEIN